MEKTKGKLLENIPAMKEITAAQAREHVSALGKPTHDDKVRVNMDKIMDEIKKAVTAGQTQVTVNAAGHHSPAMKKSVAAALDKLGYEYDLLGSDLTIFW